jgi:hypothetical protein
MTTSQYITYLMNASSNSVTRAEMLFIVNLAQNEIFSIDSYLTRTKPDPFLSTTATVFSYTLAASVRSVSRVYKLSSSAYDREYNNIYSDYKEPMALNRYGTPEINVPVDTVEALSPDTASCQIIFPSQNDPGTSTDVYLIEQYLWPTQLTAETISLSVPETIATGYLYYKVMRILEERGYGQSIYNDRKEGEKLKAEWLRIANRGAKTTRGRTLPNEIA